MQIFGIFLVALIFYLILFKNFKQSYLAILGITGFVEFNNLAGYFFKINSFEIAYSDMCQVVLLLFTLPFLKTLKRKRLRQFVFLIICSCIGTMMVLIFHPNIYVVDTFRSSWDSLLLLRTNSWIRLEVNVHSLMIFARLFIWAVIGLPIYKLTKIELYHVVNIIVKYSKIHILFTCFELVTKTFLHSNIATTMRNLIFGLGDSTYSELSTRGLGSSYSLFGFTREPSHLAQAMFLFLLLVILSKSLKENKKWAILSLMIMFMSMSFSSIMYIITLIIIFILTEKIKITRKHIIYFISTILLLIIILFKLFNNSYYSQRVLEFQTALSSLNSNTIYENVTSSKVRLYSIIETLKVYFKRPLFGLGIGSTSCYSGVVTILSNIGIIGLLSWLYYTSNAFDNKKNQIGILIFILLPNIFASGYSLLYSVYLFILIGTYFNNFSFDTI